MCKSSLSGKKGPVDELGKCRKEEILAAGKGHEGRQD